MEFKGSKLIKLLLLTQCLIVLCASEGFDFFYFVQQWPGAYCGTVVPKCFHSTKNPIMDFGIHGLWPQRKDGKIPSMCKPITHFNSSQVFHSAFELSLKTLFFY
ncbi:putative ribonuclease T(2) [Lupinus albus]|uniref:Putative ribonuclease T(2) n=1 Tax=Lupinus albus TaxID=3870 RepID=A0A6A4PUZ0_LUPAL|nr:putative ribonuclease T(2) [Lupinus albus]